MITKAGITGAVGAGAVGAHAAAASIPAMAAMSPRLMGEAAYGVGRARRAAETTRPTGLAYQAGKISNQLDPRQIIQQDAKGLLRDPEQKKRFTSGEIESIRQVARGKAPVNVVMQVKNMLERQTPQERISGGFESLAQPSPTRITVRPQYGGPM
jgi:hypothetical protein